MPAAERLHHGVSRRHDLLFGACGLYACMAHTWDSGSRLRGECQGAAFAARLLRLVQSAGVSSRNAAWSDAGWAGDDCEYAGEPEPGGKGRRRAGDTAVLQGGGVAERIGKAGEGAGVAVSI